MTRRSAGAHLDTRSALDYLEGRLDASQRRRVEEHLSGPCTACRDRLFEVERWYEAMRSDRVPELPDAVRARALDVFVPSTAADAPAPSPWAIAQLIFDSLTSPLPALARRAVGEARRLRFALDDATVEIELELESGGTHTLRGVLAAADPALYHVEARSGPERTGVWVGHDGSFAIEGLSEAPIALRVSGPTGRFELPALTP